MRTTTSTRLLLVAATLMVAACEDSSSPFESPAVPEPARPEAETASLVDDHWADGYTTSDNPTASSYTPSSLYSYNRAGGRITVQRPTGTTGRYIVTFAGLSSLLGTKSTVRVTSAGAGATHCKPMTGTVVTDKVEVRCLSMGGAPTNSEFSVVVLRRAAGRAFAFAHQPTTASYAPAGSGSYNPAGTTRINRLSTGNYQVLFNGFGAKLAGRSGHVHVGAVASGKAWCKAAEDWGGNPNLSLLVQCYTTGGLPVDAKFNVLFQLPSAHLAYAYANLPGLASYQVDPFWSSNPGGGPVTVTRSSQGLFRVTWAGVDSHILGQGNVQATAVGLYDNANCTIFQLESEGAFVRCFAANGAMVDVPFTILLGS